MQDRELQDTAKSVGVAQKKMETIVSHLQCSGLTFLVLRPATAGQQSGGQCSAGQQSTHADWSEPGLFSNAPWGSAGNLGRTTFTGPELTTGIWFCKKRLGFRNVQAWNSGGRPTTYLIVSSSGSPATSRPIWYFRPVDPGGKGTGPHNWRSSDQLGMKVTFERGSQNHVIGRSMKIFSSRFKPPAGFSSTGFSLHPLPPME
jgi:hypothetical protein